MNTARQEQFRKWIRVGLGFLLLCAFCFGIFALVTLKEVTSTQGALLNEYSADLIEAERLRSASETVVASSRGYLIFGNDESLKRVQENFEVFNERLAQVQDRIKTEAGSRLLAEVQSLVSQIGSSFVGVIEKRSQGTTVAELELEYQEMQPRRELLLQKLTELSAHKEELLQEAQHRAEQAIHRARTFMLVSACVIMMLMIAAGFMLTQLLTRRYQESQDEVGSRDEVVGILSHDLRNPLGAILLSEQLSRKLLERGRAADVPKALDQIRVAAEQMKSLVDNLLDLTRVRTGKFLGDLAPAPVSELLEKAVVANSPIAQSRNIRLLLEPVDEALLIKCDRDRIFQVLMNLIGNALKFTPKGGMVRLKACADAKKVTISVEDSGVGIPHEELPRVFDRYWQAKKARRAGAGLGLSIVKGIVEEHGGTVEVSSTPGKGTEFVFSIPHSDPSCS